MPGHACTPHVTAHNEAPAIVLVCVGACTPLSAALQLAAAAGTPAQATATHTERAACCPATAGRGATGVRAVLTVQAVCWLAAVGLRVCWQLLLLHSSWMRLRLGL